MKKNEKFCPVFKCEEWKVLSSYRPENLLNKNEKFCPVFKCEVGALRGCGEGLSGADGPGVGGGVSGADGGVGWGGCGDSGSHGRAVMMAEVLTWWELCWCPGRMGLGGGQ